MMKPWSSMVAALMPVCAALAAQEFNIPAQDLAAALESFARQADKEVIFDRRQIAGKQSVKVTGSLDADQALKALMERSGLSIRQVNERTFVIGSARLQTSDDRSAADHMRLAAETAAASAQTRPASEDAAQVTVEGKREQTRAFGDGNLDLTRTEDDVLPFTVFTARDIELSGAADLPEFLRNRLPQNFTDDNPGTGTLDGAERLVDPIDFRGWGPTETVLLLNGRRMGAENQDIFGDGRMTLASLRGVPMASIERIEILTSAGSAIYGASATGGVINIITRKDFSGGQFSVNYETPADVLRPKRALSFSYGLPVGGFSLRLSGGYNDSEPLKVRDRADQTVARYRRLAMERNPAQLIVPVSGDVSRTSTYLYGATPNIRAQATTYSTVSGSNGKPGNLFADLPGAERSNFTSVPDGYTGAGGLAAFAGREGVYNTDLAGGAGSPFALDANMGSPSRNVQFSVGLDRALGQRWNWSLDYNYGENRAWADVPSALGFTFNPALISYTPAMVPADAPSNPFGQIVAVSLIDPNLSRPELDSRPRSATWTASSVLRGRIGRWESFLDVSLSENAVRSETRYFLEPVGGWTAALMSGAYNPFVDARVVPRAAPGFYDHYLERNVRILNGTRNVHSAIKASGPAYTLPAGEIRLTAGLEWDRSRRHRSDVVTRYLDSQTGADATPFGLAPGAYYPTDETILLQYGSANARLGGADSYAAYLETTAPLLSDRQAVPLVKYLEVFASGRVDRMDRNEFANNGVTYGEYKETTSLSAYGLRYTPLQGLTLRASRSSGFKPPALSYVMPNVAGQQLPNVNVTDPRRNEPVQLTPAMYVTGGNPDLLPESTESTNVGLILQPAWLPGMRLAVDYLESLRDDAIFSLSAQEAVTLELDVPGLVQRGPADGHPSGVGPITFVDRRYRNLRQISARSLDINLEQRIADVGGGQLMLAIAATKNLSFKVQASNVGAPVEQVRNPASTLTRQMAWNGNAQLRWDSPRWSIGWSTRYYDELLVQSTYVQLQGSDRAPWQLTHDLNLNIRAPALGASGWAQLLAGSSLTLGVKNVFDRGPRFWAPSTQGTAPYDSGAIMGRTMWMQLRKDFGG